MSIAMIDYDAHNWLQHFFDIKGSMVREIIVRVLSCVIVATAVAAGHQYWRPLDMSDKPHSLIGVALGLLLVFRTNASYDRFWEGRKQWGSIVNESRNLARLASTLLHGDRALLERLVRWGMAFPWAVMYALRGEKRLRPASSFSEEEIRRVTESDHVPLAIARRMSADIAGARRRGLVDGYAHMTLDQNVQLLVDYMGACERIHKTPLPFAYVVHLRRALFLYCLSLPFALVAAFGWWTIPVTFAVAYILFGIEEIGVEIEDPFGYDPNDLPLDLIGQRIANDADAIVGAPR